MSVVQGIVFFDWTQKVFSSVVYVRVFSSRVPRVTHVCPAARRRKWRTVTLCGLDVGEARTYKVYWSSTVYCTIWKLVSQSSVMTRTCHEVSVLKLCHGASVKNNTMKCDQGQLERRHPPTHVIRCLSANDTEMWTIMNSRRLNQWD